MTPQQKADFFGVPLIPPTTSPCPGAQVDPNPVVSICGQCGLEIRQIMNYSCGQPSCPTGLGSSWTNILPDARFTISRADGATFTSASTPGYFNVQINGNTAV